ncbi:MAG: hypothetical protein D3903_21245 [Candidatus Electrothrix sp. GM3_4]|nr:hypothetical protein [Candidatus Electrothrix sp. GM3_4]
MEVKIKLKIYLNCLAGIWQEAYYVTLLAELIERAQNYPDLISCIGYREMELSSNASPLADIIEEKTERSRS